MSIRCGDEDERKNREASIRLKRKTPNAQRSTFNVEMTHRASPAWGLLGIRAGATPRISAHRFDRFALRWDRSLVRRAAQRSRYREDATPVFPPYRHPIFSLRRQLLLGLILPRDDRHW